MGTPFLWIVFNVFVLGAIALDLSVLNRHAHAVSVREALVSSLIWISLAVLFGIGILHYVGHQQGIQFFTGYLIEKSLSIDNLFLFLIIFRTFAVEERLQQRLLHWGILGALVLRGAMIYAGTELLQSFSWILYVFGVFLIIVAIRMFFAHKEQVHPEQGFIFRFANRHLRVTRGYHDEHFFIRSIGRLYATPLFLALLVVEVTDVTLALDSIPAVFGVTRDPFIVYTSNVFAILGLRAMYFLLAGTLNRLRFLTVGLSLVLLFIGGKMLAEPWLHISETVSLLVVGGILLLAVGASLLVPAKQKHISNR